eukprot:8362169-Lingulodinium_polyedra.AAC.1
MAPSPSSLVGAPARTPVPAQGPASLQGGYSGSTAVPLPSGRRPDSAAVGAYSRGSREAALAIASEPTALAEAVKRLRT